MNVEPDPPDEQSGPEQELLMAEAVGAALLLVLDELNPAERLAFVLHDVFDLSFEEIARVVERSPSATRQRASRARRRVRGASTESAIDRAAHRRIVEQFPVAARTGDLAGLMTVLDPAVELRPDDVAKSLGALKPTWGATAVAATVAAGVNSLQAGLVEGIPASCGTRWSPAWRDRPNGRGRAHHGPHRSGRTLAPGPARGRHRRLVTFDEPHSPLLIVNRKNSHEKTKGNEMQVRVRRSPRLLTSSVNKRLGQHSHLTSRSRFTPTTAASIVN